MHALRAFYFYSKRSIIPLAIPNISIKGRENLYSARTRRNVRDSTFQVFLQLAMLAGFQRARNSLFVWKTQIPIKLTYCTNAVKIKNTTACLLFTYDPSTKNVWELKICS